MNSYEVVNYYTDGPDGIEARDVLYRTFDSAKAWAELDKVAEQLGVELPAEGESFDHEVDGLFENYYLIEAVEIDA